MGKARARLNEQDREERRRQDRERLERATAELLSSDGWRRWLRTRSVLHGYSVTNTLLIAQQAYARGIEPTYVAGFKAWLRLGRAVAKGQKGFQIWVPMRIKVRDQDGKDTDERKLRFRTTTVFDISQTDPIPGVEPAPLAPPYEPIYLGRFARPPADRTRELRDGARLQRPRPAARGQRRRVV